MAEQFILTPEDLERSGLYLVLDNSTTLDLTDESLKQITDRYWRDHANAQPASA